MAEAAVRPTVERWAESYAKWDGERRDGEQRWITSQLHSISVWVEGQKSEAERRRASDQVAAEERCRQASDWHEASEATRRYRIVERMERAERAASGPAEEKASAWSSSQRNAAAGWKKQRIIEVEAMRDAALKRAVDFKRTFLAKVFAEAGRNGCGPTQLQRTIDAAVISVLQSVHDRCLANTNESSQVEVNRIRALVRDAQDKCTQAWRTVNELALSALAEAERATKAAAPTAPHPRAVKRPGPIDAAAVRKKAAPSPSPTPSPLTAVRPGAPTSSFGVPGRSSGTPAASFAGRQGPGTLPGTAPPLRRGSFLKMSKPPINTLGKRK